MSRTAQQNKAIHVYLQMVADALNDAGLDVQTTLSKPLEMPWNEHLAKELIWRPVQTAMLEKESTTELTTAEVSQVYDVIARHLATTYGVDVPFPAREEI